jgi:uncharacterized protein (TIGR03000 family)
MYSVVLMAAITTGTATPDFGHRRGGCHGCFSSFGCHGCSGGGWGCSGGWGCNGCSGIWTCSGGWGHHGAGYHGGWGGSACWGCYGCYGGAGWGGPYAGYGHGTYVEYCAGCYGGGGYCAGCYGFGGYCAGCYGGCGGGWGCAGWGCHGCAGGAVVCSCAGGYGGLSGYPMPHSGMVVPTYPETPGVEKVGPPDIKDKDKGKGKGKGDDDEVSGRGRLVVELPEDARLYIDGQPMKTKSGRRVFQTPPLATGQSYYYILRAEVTREGRTQRESVRVIIRPGRESYATFPTLAPAPRATTTVSR